ncbi:MAG: antitoxin [Caldiserica bacterium CG02_land_8_20_14_3_00_36_38]|nr:MAG: antitoxin [Caldiserica bacterium CG02_land_8_20_14_3_00_36_38]
MRENLLERIEINPKILMGKPVIKGTRLPVEIILEKLAYGYTEEDILKDYPFLTRDDIKASLLYAAKVLAFEEEYVIDKS